jgi:hypothetical protein
MNGHEIFATWTVTLLAFDLAKFREVSHRTSAGPRILSERIGGPTSFSEKMGAFHMSCDRVLLQLPIYTEEGRKENLSHLAIF